MLLKDFLGKEFLGTAAANIRSTAAQKRFSKFFLDDTNLDWAYILSKFAIQRPWTFWDDSTVSTALAILERDLDRSVDAFSLRSGQIGIALDNLFRLSQALLYEDPLDASKSRALLRLSTEFHPEYLRHNEHVFANLICFYWSVLKKGSVIGKFDIRGAVALFESQGLQSLLQGYDDRVRNGIAHGQVVFKGLGSIQYGSEKANYSLASFQFLEIFDNLWRTCNALTIAVLLFLARNEQKVKASRILLPPNLIAFIAAGLIERQSLSVHGAIESETTLAGKQLHIFVRTTVLLREWVIYDCMRISALLLKHGASGYERFIFDIDQGKTVSSQLITRPRTLQRLLDNPDTPLSQFNEALDDTPLLWFNETHLSHRVRSWKEIWWSLARQSWNNLQDQWERDGIRISNQSYRIIKVKDASSEQDRRLHVYAVLETQERANDREYLKRVIRKIVRSASKISTRKDTLFGKRRSLPGRPTYVWVSLYKSDGTFRWVTSGGWLGGNLIVTAEKVFSLTKPPISEKNPELVWKGIRFRFSMNVPAYAEAMTSLAESLSEVRPKHSENSTNE